MLGGGRLLPLRKVSIMSELVKMTRRLARILPAGWQVFHNQAYDIKLDEDARALCRLVRQEYEQCTDFRVSTPVVALFIAHLPADRVINRARDLAFECGIKFSVLNVDPPRPSWRSGNLEVTAINPVAAAVQGVFAGTPD